MGTTFTRARARTFRSIVAAAALAAVVPIAVSAGDARALGDTCSAPITDADWPMFNHDLAGSRSNPAEATFTPQNVGGLREVWRFDTPPGALVYGSPVIAGGCVYAADTLGNVYSLAAADGAVNWVSTASPVAAFPQAVTSTPVVTEDLVIVGDQSGIVHALGRADGLPVWKQRPNNDGYPAIYGQPSVTTIATAGGPREVVLVPIASNEETFTPTEVQPCCRSRGSVAALDLATGAIVWQTYMVSDEEAAAGASGASVWTMPAYDAESNTVYVATGNNFGNSEASAKQTATGDAIVAIDAATGAIRWANQRYPDDTWVIGYSLSEADPEHPDFDFGDGVNLFELTGHRKVVAAGQKSGFLHVLDAETGHVLDQEQVMPGGGLGGIFADSAYSDGVLYVNGNNWPDQIPLNGPRPKEGYLVAVDVQRGLRGQAVALEEVWRYTSSAGTPMMGGPAIAGDVVFVHASGEGNLHALDRATGAVLATVPVGGAVNSPTVAGGRVLIGVGDNSAIASTNQLGAIIALGL